MASLKKNTVITVEQYTQLQTIIGLYDGGMDPMDIANTTNQPLHICRRIIRLVHKDPSYLEKFTVITSDNKKNKRGYGKRTQEELEIYNEIIELYNSLYTHKYIMEKLNVGPGTLQRIIRTYKQDPDFLNKIRIKE